VSCALRSDFIDVSHSAADFAVEDGASNSDAAFLARIRTTAVLPELVDVATIPRASARNQDSLRLLLQRPALTQEQLAEVNSVCAALASAARDTSFDDKGLEHVTVAFKSYVPRSEMWRFQMTAVNSVVYEGKAFAVDNIRVHVNGLETARRRALCGVVTKDTKFAFRSRCAHFTILIQLSKEMWEFATDGNLYFEKVRAEDALVRALQACHAFSCGVVLAARDRRTASSPCCSRSGTPCL
jgi:hypothetical protein